MTDDLTKEEALEEWEEIFKWAQRTIRESQYSYAHPVDLVELETISSETPREYHEKLWFRIADKLEFNTWQLAEFVEWVRNYVKD